MIIGLNARFLDEPHTGRGQFVRHLCRALLSAAPEHRFCLYVRPQCPIPDFPGDNWRMIRIPLSDGDMFDRHFTETAEFSDACPDLLHITHLRMPEKALKIPVVLTIHDIIPVSFMSIRNIICGRTPLRALSTMGIVSRFTDPAQIHRATVVNTISGLSARDLGHFYHCQATVIPNGLDPAFREPVSPAAIREARIRHGLAGDYCINFGGLAFRKNLLRQVRAFSRLRTRYPELRFVIAGTGFWHRKLAGKKIPGVLFTGTIGREELRTLAAGAVFSLYPSLYEGFGLPVLESLALGVPVLTARESAMAEILPGSTLLADPRSVPALAAGMETLLRDRAAWQKKVRAARPGLDEYSWENAARRYLELYRQAAGST